MRPDFALDRANAAAVAEICRRLDGVPLAIELAAARVRVMAPEQIAARLDDCLRLLSGGAASAPDRQQTLRATIDWSYQLLGEAERALFARLSVFAGGWTLEAAEAICAGDGVLDALTSLVERSLVAARQHGAAMRYRFLEPVRAYARERLDQGGERPRVVRTHAEFFLELAEQAAPELTGADQASWLSLLEQEHANLRVALGSLREGRDTASHALRLAAALWHFWWLRGYLTEGRAELRAVLGAGAAAPAGLRARALHALGELAFRQGDPAEAGEVLGSALDAARDAGDRHGMAAVIRSLGRLAIEEGRHADARSLLNGCVEIERDLAGAPSPPWALVYLGWLALFEGGLRQAEALLRDGLARARRASDDVGIGVYLYSLAQLALEHGDTRAAARRAAESLRVLYAVRFVYGALYALETMADVAALQRRFKRALRLAGAAAALRQTTGAPAAAPFCARHEQRLAVARAALGAGAAAVWSHGRMLSLSDSVTEALRH